MSTIPPPPAPPPAQRRGSQLTVLLLGAIAGVFLLCLGLTLGLTLGSRLSSGSSFSSGRGAAVAVLHLEGVIVSGQGDSFSTTAVAASGTLLGDIERAAQDPDVRAVVLAVNSPGGGVVASDEIYHALSELDKPVVVVMGDMAASGGYYVSMAADWIVAHPNSLIGSIGVISEFPNYSGLLDKIGVDFMVITSGPRKDFGSPYREMSEAERAYWQTIIDETYQGFVEIVADGRGLTLEQVAPLADGSIFSGRQALELNLVDELGYEAQAVARAAELGGIEGEPRIIEYEHRPSLISLLTELASTGRLLPSREALLGGLSPRLSMLWLGQ